MRNSSLRIVKVCCILIIGAWPARAQVDCPAMGITRPKVNQKRISGGFGSFRAGGAKGGPMADYFSTRSHGPGRVKEHTEFATRGGRKRFFRDMDEFATKRQGGESRYRDFDEFSRKGGRKSRFRDFDEFTSRSNRQAESNRRGSAGTASRGFHRSAKRVHSQDSRSARGRTNRKDYTPFSSTVSPFADQIPHREPQMGLWGGTIGKRGGKEKRKMTVLPEKSDGKDD